MDNFNLYVFNKENFHSNITFVLSVSKKENFKFAIVYAIREQQKK